MLNLKISFKEDITWQGEPLKNIGKLFITVAILAVIYFGAIQFATKFAIPHWNWSSFKATNAVLLLGGFTTMLLWITLPLPYGKWSVIVFIVVVSLMCFATVGYNHYLHPLNLKTTTVKTTVETTVETRVKDAKVKAKAPKVSKPSASNEAGTIWFLSNFWHAITGPTPAEKLAQKISDISSLKSKVVQKRSDISGLITNFSKKAKVLKAEIRKQKKAKGVRTYEEAKKDQEISLSLRLLQRNIAYTDKLVIAKTDLAKTINDMTFLESNLQYDMEMIAVLEPEEFKELSEKIQSAIEQYMPYANELIINTDDLQMKSFKDIWGEL